MTRSSFLPTVLALLLINHAAGAQPAPVLVLSRSTGPEADHVRRELGALGIESAVVIGAPVTGSWVVEVTGAAGSREALVWWCASSGTRVLRHAVREVSTNDSSFEVRVAEAVRAMWTSDESISTSIKEPKAALSSDMAPTAVRPNYRLSVHAGASLPNGPTHAAGFAILAAHWIPLPSDVGLGVVLVLPIVPAQIDRQRDSAEVSSSMFGLEATASIIPQAWRLDWQAQASLGVLAQWIRTVGLAQYPNESVRDTVWSSMAHGRVTLGRRWSPDLSLQASLLVGISAPPVGIRFAGESVADWGRPLGLITAGVAFDR